jgi:hypothetical protein
MAALNPNEVIVPTRSDYEQALRLYENRIADLEGQVARLTEMLTESMLSTERLLSFLRDLGKTEV